jgi:hypothetical protein
MLLGHMRSMTMRIRAVFRRGDEDAVNVLRLAAAANDLDMVARILLWEEDDVPHSRRRYALRMSALHISEIADLVNHSDFSRVLQRCSRRSGFEEILALGHRLRLSVNAGPVRHVIGRARNGFGGHYDPKLIAAALEKVDDADLMDIPASGARHNVVDTLFDISFAEISHAQYRLDTVEESYKAAIGGILDVHNALVPLIQGVVAAMYAEAQGV